MSKKQDNAVVNRHVVRRIMKYGKPYIGWFLLILLIIVGTVRLELWQPELIEQTADAMAALLKEKGFFTQKDAGVADEGFRASCLRNITLLCAVGVVIGLKYNIHNSLEIPYMIALAGGISMIREKIAG